MSDHKFRHLVPVLLGGLALISSSAQAGFKAVRVQAAGVPAINAASDVCNGYVFSSEQAGKDCVRSKILGALPAGMNAGTISGKYANQGGSCVPYSGSYSLVISSSAQIGSWNYNGGSQSFALIEPNSDWAGQPGEYFQLYANYTCSTKSGGSFMDSSGGWTFNSVPENGDDGPSDNKPCRLNAKWAGLMIPKGAAGTEPAEGSEFGVGYKSALMSGLPVHFEGGRTASSPTLPGTIMKVAMSSTEECHFRRDKREQGTDKAGVTWYTYTLSYHGTDKDGQAEAAEPEVEIVVTGSRKKSKPIVPYGDKFLNGIAARLSTLDKAIAEMENRNSSITTASGQPVPVTVKVECPKIGNVCLLPYNHPDPERKVRDNPGCGATEHDPRCAWSLGAEAASATTKKEDLIRLANDGQTIVRNDPAVYPGTVYPQAMVQAGVAPDNTQPAGTVENPGDAGSADGAEGRIGECLKSGECKITDESLNDYYASIGVDKNKDGSAGGVAGGIASRALAKGKCEKGSTSPYCGLVASLGVLSNRQVAQTGDLTLWEGDWTFADGRVQHEKMVMPEWIVNLLELFFNIMAIFTAFIVALKGRLTLD